jgi:type II secretory pathway pseudopilin PulG
MRQKHKSHKGFLLVETMISITVLLMVSAIIITLLVTANRAINFNAHSLEASWLTQECVNAFRGLRDTNWIRFSYDKEACWNMTTSNCAPANAIAASTNYTIETSTTMPPEMAAQGDPLNLTDGEDPADQNYKLYIQADGTTNHDSAGEETLYFRTLETTSATASQIDAVCRIEWLEGSDPKSISLPVTITNFALEE